MDGNKDKYHRFYNLAKNDIFQVLLLLKLQQKCQYIKSNNVQSKCTREDILTPYTIL